MSISPQHIDKPEPRGRAVLAFLAICAIYLALPRNLVIGPIWLLPTLIVVLLVPTVVSHRVGRQSLNRTLGFVINGITTLALIGSVILLVRALPGHRESPVRLLRSGGLLWLTNVIVFAFFAPLREMSMKTRFFNSLVVLLALFAHTALGQVKAVK